MNVKTLIEMLRDTVGEESSTEVLIRVLEDSGRELLELDTVLVEDNDTEDYTVILEVSEPA